VIALRSHSLAWFRVSMERTNSAMAAGRPVDRRPAAAETTQRPAPRRRDSLRASRTSEKALSAFALRSVSPSPECLSGHLRLSAILGLNLRTELGSELSFEFDLVRDAKELADELAKASPKTRVCLHAKRYANRQHQETCFQFVHDLPLLYALGVPSM
jgi:hypothetical protein